MEGLSEHNNAAMEDLAQQLGQRSATAYLLCLSFAFFPRSVLRMAYVYFVESKLAITVLAASQVNSVRRNRRLVDRNVSR